MRTREHKADPRAFTMASGLPKVARFSVPHLEVGSHLPPR
jgi:hypothetical protein